MPNATRAVAAVTPLLTAAVTATSALSSSSVIPLPRAFSIRFRVHTWQPRVIVTANPTNCVCGTNDCNADTGLFCDASKNQCDDVPYCATTDGTAANPANCACGTADCDAATTGLFCDASKNSCSKIAGLHTSLYPIVTSGT